jgi:hypothetical protein
MVKGAKLEERRQKVLEGLGLKGLRGKNLIAM